MNPNQMYIVHGTTTSSPSSPSSNTTNNTMTPGQMYPMGAITAPFLTHYAANPNMTVPVLGKPTTTQMATQPTTTTAQPTQMANPTQPMAKPYQATHMPVIPGKSTSSSSGSSSFARPQTWSPVVLWIIFALMLVFLVAFLLAMMSSSTWQNKYYALAAVSPVAASNAAANLALPISTAPTAPLY